MTDSRDLLEEVLNSYDNISLRTVVYNAIR